MGVCASSTFNTRGPDGIPLLDDFADGSRVSKEIEKMLKLEEKRLAREVKVSSLPLPVIPNDLSRQLQFATRWHYFFEFE